MTDMRRCNKALYVNVRVLLQNPCNEKKKIERWRFYYNAREAEASKSELGLDYNLSV